MAPSIHVDRGPVPLDEQDYTAPEKPPKKMGVRTAMLCALDTSKAFFAGVFGGGRSQRKSAVSHVKHLGEVCRYGFFCNRMAWRVTPVDVKQLVTDWIDAIVGMCLAHDKDTYDSHDAKADKLLTPLLTAPIAQVREFYHALHAAMKADKRVPMLVWMAFDAWGEVMVKDAPDEGTKRLKKKLAAEITDLVEEDVKEQLPAAIARALMWRDAETLEKVKEAAESGRKPKLRGRESCLFLEFDATPTAEKVSVMV